MNPSCPSGGIAIFALTPMPYPTRRVMAIQPFLSISQLSVALVRSPVNCDPRLAALLKGESLHVSGSEYTFAEMRISGEYTRHIQRYLHQGGVSVQVAMLRFLGRLEITIPCDTSLANMHPFLFPPTGLGTGI